MSRTAFILGNFRIEWSAVIITMGLLCGLLIAVALYRGREKNSAAAWLCFCFSFVFGTFFSRTLHWYFNEAAYTSFGQALTDFSVGSFCLPGMILGLMLGAWLVKLTRLVRSKEVLLDCFAPGMVLSIAFIRLSALFNESCRSRITIENEALQHLPFAIASADAAGNVSYRLATFFIAFLLLTLLSVIVLVMYLRSGRRSMKKPCREDGNVWRMTLLYWSALEVILDSTRYDSPLMHFRLISYLNQYSAFISLAQIFGGFCAIAALVYYSRVSIKANGFKFYHPLCWAVFALSFYMIGYLGEYKVQRESVYLRSYSFMAVGCVLMVLSVQLLYQSCVERSLGDGKKPNQEAGRS